jgi:hypothetical protein
MIRSSLLYFKICSWGFYRSLFCIFLSYIVFSINFRTLYNFLEFILENEFRNWKKQGTVVGRWFGPRPQPAGLAQPRNRLGGPCQRHGAGVRTDRSPRATRRRWHGGCRRLGRWGVGRPVARASWIHGECAGQGERWCNSPSKQGSDKVTETGSGSDVFGDGGVIRWSLVAEEGS